MQFDVVDDLEVFLLDPGEVDALDVHQAQQLTHRLRHRPAALVARAAALSYSDHGPEFLLVHAEAPADLARVDEFEQLHLVLRYHPKYWRCHANSMEHAKAEAGEGPGRLYPYVQGDFAIIFNDFSESCHGADRPKIRWNLGRNDRTDQTR